MSAYLYILKSKSSGRYYIGSTTDLKRRISQHLSGHTYATKRMLDFELVFSQEFIGIKEARVAELRLKRWKRRDFIDKVVSEGKLKTV